MVTEVTAVLPCHRERAFCLKDLCNPVGSIGAVGRLHRSFGSPKSAPLRMTGITATSYRRKCSQPWGRSSYLTPFGFRTKMPWVWLMCPICVIATPAICRGMRLAAGAVNSSS